MKRNVIETIIGAVVLSIAALFLAFGLQMNKIGSSDGYNVYANFSNLGGLGAGDDVTISGVKVGKVSNISLDPASYMARVDLSLNNTIRLPADTAALISSESLLGGKYLALEPGGEEEVIEEGGRVLYTQAPQNLEQLLGKFIFSMQKDGDEAEGAAE